MERSFSRASERCWYESDRCLLHERDLLQPALFRLLVQLLRSRPCVLPAVLAPVPSPLRGNPPAAPATVPAWAISLYALAAHAASCACPQWPFPPPLSVHAPASESLPHTLETSQTADTALRGERRAGGAEGSRSEGVLDCRWHIVLISTSMTTGLCVRCGPLRPPTQRP